VGHLRQRRAHGDRAVSRRPNPARLGVVAVALAGIAAAGCGDSGDQRGGASLTLVAYDSFLAEGTPLIDALDEFTADTGIKVTVLNAGDTGTMVTKAVLTAGNPEGDVMWGVDTTFLSAATDGNVFDGDPVEVDYGDVCVNYDIEWFETHGVEPPTSLDDLALPPYRGLLAVPDPSKSSPGLAFLLATVDAFGEGGWQDYWRSLRDNGVAVTDSWDTMYFESFTRAGGDRPLVVSYGSSPPYEVLNADPPRNDAPTAVIADTCVRQTEYAGVLRGADQPDNAAELVDFLRSERFQRELPLSLYVYPAVDGIMLPDAFVRHTVIPDDPLTIDPSAVGENRERWQDEWTQIVLR
jgi:thiamine transport system substrate-binding protein